jgi:hypothetical protein
MAGAAVVAAALTDHAAKAKILTVGGLDVLRAPSPGTYGVDVESVELVEASAGQVSRLTFTIDDPEGALTFDERAVVHFYDATRGIPLFLGFLEAARFRQVGLGRAIDVTATGIEAVLDWMICPAATIPAAMAISDGVQMLVGQAFGVGVQIRAFVASSTTSTQARPICNNAATAPADVAIPAGTLRASLRALVTSRLGGVSTTGIDFLVTVDAYAGLRVYVLTAAGDAWVSDWDPLDGANGVNSVAGPLWGAALEHSVDAAGAYHQVLVKGGPSAPVAQLLVGDGSGAPGPIGLLSDSTSTTIEGMTATALAWMRGRRVAVRGRVRVEELLDVGGVVTQRHPGVLFSVRDAQVIGPALFVSYATEVRKRFHASGTETWTIAYGAQAPSMARLVRRLTRDVVT